MINYLCGIIMAVGAALAAEIADLNRPTTPVEPTPAPTWWSNPTATLYVVPPTWWAQMPTDAYNVLGAPRALVDARGDYVPGYVVTATAYGEGWAVGYGLIAGTETNLWQPADDRRGDLARRLMYMALMYPQTLWHGRAIQLYEDGGWPLLSRYGIEILMEWHRADPVDEREVAEMQALAAIQGNENPFVAIPDLAEYLWGEHAGEPLPDDEPTPPVNTPKPLRASYSISSDKVIDLCSPYVPSTASWSIDGKAISTPSISLVDIGIGRHELTFTSTTASGSMLFDVKP